MFDLLKNLNEEIKDQELPELKIGVGINSGDVVVGNMGSEQRFDYTCLGDAVNLSSRLEGQTKEYGVGLIVGQGTVKGIDVSHHGKFLELYRERKWSAALQLLELNTITYPYLERYYRMMKKRISLLKKSKLNNTWDTIYRATSK